MKYAMYSAVVIFASSAGWNDSGPSLIHRWWPFTAGRNSTSTRHAMVMPAAP